MTPERTFKIIIADMGETFPVEAARFIATLDDGETRSIGIAAPDVTDACKGLAQAIINLYR